MSSDYDVTIINFKLNTKGLITRQYKYEQHNMTCVRDAGSWVTGPLPIMIFADWHEIINWGPVF